MNEFDGKREEYIARNRETALHLYGDRLDDSRRVRGTRLWFDQEWRLHGGEGQAAKSAPSAAQDTTTL